jgi:hypothetical protein
MARAPVGIHASSDVAQPMPGGIGFTRDIDRSASMPHRDFARDA